MESGRNTEPRPLSRKQRIQARRREARTLSSQRKEIGRRNFIKGAIILGSAATVLGPAALWKMGSKEQKEETSLKEKVLSFTWEDARDQEKLRIYTEQLADSYLELTKTPRLKKEDLIGPNATSFYQDTKSYINAVRAVEPQYKPSQTAWGYTHYDSKRVFIDFNNIKRQATEQNHEAGATLLDALWHEWGHLDISSRTQGELINNPEVGFYSPVSGRDETPRRYRGAEVYTDTYHGYSRFEEVLNETITARRMIEQVGLPEIISAADYYENGVDFFPKFTSAHIPLETLYQMHATSDLEGLAKTVGQNLPGSQTPLLKGIELFTAIHQSDPAAIAQTGVFERMPR